MKDEIDRLTANAQSKEWMQTTVNNLHQLISQIYSIPRDSMRGSIQLSSSMVKSALGMSAVRLLKRCGSVLAPKSVAVLLQNVVMLAFHPFPSLRSPAQIHLDSFLRRASQSDDHQKQLLEAIQTNLRKVVGSLPRKMRNADDETKIEIVKLIENHICVLLVLPSSESSPSSSSFQMVLNTLLPKLASGILQSIETDLFHIRRRSSMPSVKEKPTALLMPSSEGIGLSTPNHISGSGVYWRSQRWATENSFQDETLTRHSNTKKRRMESMKYPRKTFKHFRDERVGEELISLCRLLAFAAHFASTSSAISNQSGFPEIHLLFDYFLDLISKDDMVHEAEAILVLNELILGASGIFTSSETTEFLRAKLPNQNTQTNEWKDIVLLLAERLLDEYLSSETFNPQRRSAISDRVHNSCETESGLLVALAMIEGLGNIAQVIANANYPLHAFFIKALYPLLDKLVESDSVKGSSLIREYAWVTLSRIASYANYSSLSAMIEDNMDYLIDTICKNMKHIHSFPNTPSILQGLLQHTQVPVLPLLKDTMEQICRSLDLQKGRESKLTISFLSLLKSILNIFYDALPEMVDTTLNDREEQPRQLDAKRSEESGESLDGAATATPDDIQKYFEEYHSNHNTHASEQEEDNDLTGDNQQIVEDPRSKQIKDVTETILTRCQHFFNFRKTDAKLIVQDAVQLGLKILEKRDTPTNSKLLPMIHTLWMPLVSRLRDVDPVVVIKTLETIAVFADLSKDFIARKFTEDAWPTLSSLLEEHQTNSKHSVIDVRQINEQKVFEFSSSYKLQRAILRCLTAVFPHVRHHLSAEDVLQRLENVPPSLQSEAAALLSSLRRQ
eukprot:TRINITY_DN2212_c0_g1_i4.p2 TRINITY_DN2212_c0_g1~~TRINITY_DN2212_c0_g1_i4.p2  ORF type:complete len:871 (-),score=208.96 TRINITY_DN2212_c0_g1_i4:3057-5591(-)